MRSRSLAVVGLLLALGWGVAVSCVAPRQAWGDQASGPDRVTLATRPWGTVYYRVGLRNRYPLEPDMTGQYTFGLPEGDARTNPEGAGYAITYPDKSELLVQVEGDEVRALFRRKEFAVRRTLTGFAVRLPGDSVTYARKGRDASIKGRAGTVTVTEDTLGFDVTSPAGKTSYRRASFDEPFRLSGIPMAVHPYVRRGIHIESVGLGVFLAFPIQDLGRAFSALPWEPLLLFE